MNSPLRPYQQRAVSEVQALWNSGTKRVCLVAPTGAGKTRMLVELLGESALWLVHRRELVTQAEHAIRTAGKQARIATVQGLLSSGERPPVALVVWDECFPAGTHVGDVAIEEVAPGDTVPCFDHATGCLTRSRVVRVFKTQARQLVRITTNRGTVVCTSGHPFFSLSSGYVKAMCLRPGDEVLYVDSVDLLGLSNDLPPAAQGLEELHPTVWGKVSGGGSGGQEETNELLRVQSGSSHQDKDTERSSASRCGLLLDRMPQRGVVRQEGCDDASNKPEVRIGAHAQPKSDVSERSKRSGIGCVAQEEPLPRATGRQWEVGSDSAGLIGSRPGMADGGRGPNRTTPQDGISEPLQTRYSQSDSARSRRSGWTESRFTKAPGPGPTQGYVSYVARVDSVEILEPGSDGRFDGLCPDGNVYNLEVEHYHNYFANGFLVHNCHHSAAEQWSGILGAYPAARIVGATATPERRDGVGLGGLFDALVVATHYSELLADGHLVPCRVIRPEQRLTSGIATDPVEAYQQHTPGDSGFVFAPRIADVIDIAKRFNDAGIPAASVDAETPTDIRDRAVSDLATGRLKILANVFALTEGVDIPHASVCVLARGCTHVGPFLQMAGRILRPYPGKAEATLLDLSGVTHEFGKPTDDRIYSLTGRPISVAAPSVTVCLKCGASYESGPDACPACGFVRPSKDWQPVRIYNAKLVDYYLGAATDDRHKLAEYLRLRDLARLKGWSVAWVVREYKKLFGHSPDLGDVTPDERFGEYIRLRDYALDRGWKPGYAAVRYKELFGDWPEWAWRKAA